jgi:hypothetical protein
MPLHISKDRLNIPIYDAGNFGIKPYRDNNGNYYLKAFDKFDLGKTVYGGSFAENKLRKSDYVYPNSGPFIVRDDSIPVTFNSSAKDDELFKHISGK